jgi:hypothetical protein
MSILLLVLIKEKNQYTIGSNVTTELKNNYLHKEVQTLRSQKYKPKSHYFHMETGPVQNLPHDPFFAREHARAPGPVLGMDRE